MQLNYVQIFLEDQKLTAICDLLIEETPDTSTHPDSPITLTVKEIQVVKVHSVNYLAMDCVDIDLTTKFKKDGQLSKKLELAIIEDAEYKTIDELKTAA